MAADPTLWTMDDVAPYFRTVCCVVLDHFIPALEYDVSARDKVYGDMHFTAPADQVPRPPAAVYPQGSVVQNAFVNMSRDNPRMVRLTLRPWINHQSRVNPQDSTQGTFGPTFAVDVHPARIRSIVRVLEATPDKDVEYWEAQWQRVKDAAASPGVGAPPLRV